MRAERTHGRARPRTRARAHAHTIEIRPSKSQSNRAALFGGFVGVRYCHLCSRPTRRSIAVTQPLYGRRHSRCIAVGMAGLCAQGYLGHAVDEALRVGLAECAVRARLHALISPRKSRDGIGYGGKRRRTHRARYSRYVAASRNWPLIHALAVSVAPYSRCSARRCPGRYL